MNTKLILRSLTSPFPTPYSDITKGSVLSHADVDNNFIYLKGQTIYSAESISQTVILHKLNGDVIQFNVGGSGSTGIKNIIRPTDDIIVERDFQYLVYGDLTLAGGKLTNAGDVVIINGGLINNGGTYISSGGTIELVTLPISVGLTKFIIATNITANTPLIITHNLGTSDVVINVKDLNTNEKIVLSEYNYNSNDVTLESTQTLTNIKITIIG